MAWMKMHSTDLTVPHVSLSWHSARRKQCLCVSLLLPVNALWAKSWFCSFLYPKGLYGIWLALYTKEKVVKCMLEWWKSEIIQQASMNIYYMPPPPFFFAMPQGIWLSSATTDWTSGPWSEVPRPKPGPPGKSLHVTHYDGGTKVLWLWWVPTLRGNINKCTGWRAMGCKRCLEPGGVTEALGLTVVGHREDFTRGSKCFYVEMGGRIVMSKAVWMVEGVTTDRSLKSLCVWGMTFHIYSL